MYSAQKSSKAGWILAALILCAAALLLTRKANATETTLKTNVRAFQAACPSLRCENSTLRLRTPSSAELAALPTGVKAALIKKAKGQAESVWPDTVLEGPYETNFRLRTESIEFLLFNEHLIGYRVTVSAPAWEIEKCNYNPDNKSTLKDCPEGRIQESLFISANLNEIFGDEQAYADFTPAGLNKSF